jgi:magnesium transporter
MNENKEFNPLKFAEMLTIYLKQYNKIIRNAEPELLDNLGYDDILWLDLLSPTIKEQKAVENFMEESLQTRQQVEEIESTSKYSENENSIISNTNFFIPQNDGTFEVEPVSFIISNEGVLVSQRTAESRTFRETEKRLQMNYRSYSTGYHIFISLLEVRIDFDADLVELVAKNVAKLSKDINTEDTIDKEVIHRINALQESTMVLRENFFDRQRILSNILRSERFPNDIYPRLQLMIKDVNSLINHADFSSQRLDYIQDSALGLINIEQNEIVKIFSVASVIFMPATLIASIYGMNFHFMPELDWVWQVGNMTLPLGYIFAIGLMIMASGLTIWFFRYKKWL